MTRLTATNGAKVEFESLCLLYDGKTGAIRHRHRAVTLSGGRQPSEAEIERDALTVAAKLGVPAGLEVLHVRPEQMAVRGLYRIDLQSRAPVFVRPPVRLALRPMERVQPPGV